MEVTRDAEDEPQNNDWAFSYFKFDKKRDSADQVRNSILVVAALVATASFQALMNPPDAITKATKNKIVAFVCLNVLAWSSSMTIIERLTISFPFQAQLRLSYIAMGATFGLVSQELGATGGRIQVILFIICLLLPYFLNPVLALIKSIWRAC